MHSEDLSYTSNRASEDDLIAHFQRCDKLFTPPLSSQVSLKNFAGKIRKFGVTFEAWRGTDLVAVTAGYFNNKIEGEAYITMMSVEARIQGRGIGKKLMICAVEYATQLQFSHLRLEVARDSTSAIRLYRSLGFMLCEERVSTLILDLELNAEDSEKGGPKDRVSDL